MQKIPKKWRELPIKQKLSIPEKIFKIDKKKIEKIREIIDPKKRLIEAGRLQYRLFGDIHTFLTVWIAGFASDRTVREYLGSTQNLRDLFIEPLKRVRGIGYSWSDIKRKVIIPNKMSNELAEETGIHIGDGNLYFGKDRQGYDFYDYNISGDLIDEYLYHTIHIKNLIKSIYNIELRFSERPNKNSIDSRIRSKAVIQFKNKILGLCFGPKKNIRIPKVILKDNEFMKRLVIGILDTDFNITEHFAISGKIYSMLVAKEMHRFFNKNKIKHIYRDYGDYARFYINKEGASKIIEKWKLNNPKHLSKISVFKKFGTFIPFTTTPERLALLYGKITLDELNKVSEERVKGREKISLFNYK